MKSLWILCVLGVSLYAQPAAAPKQAPAKAAATPAKTGTATKAPAAPAPSPALLNPAALKARCPDLLKVKFTTTKGDFVVEVHRDWSPLGADRFYNLVKNRFFNGAPFFRVMPGFIVQFGLSGDPAINKAWQHTEFKDDPVTPTNSNKKGTLVFATAGPNTRTTQLFINLNNNTPLDAQGFTAFGMVTEGMEVVNTIYSGYGEAPDQGRLTNEGKAYFEKTFPKLDKVVSTTILFPEATSAPATPKKSTGAPATKGASAQPATPKK
jgi:peptidyl-prolyl cis-trans isomerase A (cyclophilin A)